MILICGVPTETSMARVLAALDRADVEYLLVNQRQARQLTVELTIDDAGVGGFLAGPGFTIDLEKVTGVYLRLMDDRWLPEFEHEDPDSPARVTGRALHEIIGHWADVTPARVINRYVAMGSNFSKPYQLQLISEQGFAVPRTLVTNDPDQVRAFREEVGGLIYKSISSERSIVHRLRSADLPRLNRIRWCPVQFQEFVDGPNVRVHTVGDRVFATRIDTDAVDYRYAARQTGQVAQFRAVELDDELQQRCVRLAASLGLDVAGLDLKFATDGRVVCLEVNPSPVFSYYEQFTGQPISEAVAGLLAATV